MPSPPDLVDLVRCPACRSRLRASADAFDCEACDTRYPVQGGVPWLYRDVAGARAQWAAKLQYFRSELLAELEALDAAQAREDLLPSTRERLTRQRAGQERFGQEVLALLEPFALSHSEVGAGLPAERIPSAQHVTSYLETAYRDWAWGRGEIQQTLGLAEPLLGDAGAAILVLGGGAGRLAWELAQRRPGAAIVQLDLNPLLSRIAALVSRGESTTLTELPRFPLSVDDSVVEQTLAAPGKTTNAPHYLLGDAFAPPFAEESFDLLVTPWFVDIVPEDFASLAPRLARWLRPGGRWVSFGPLSFEQQSPADRLTPEEVVDTLERAGFEVLEAGTETVAHLHSPHAMPRRGEEVFAFAAKRPPALAEVEDFAYYPGWLRDGRRAIPLDPRFDAMRAERTFDVEILKCIDGRAGIEDLVVILSSRYGLAPDRCRATIERFFSRWFEGLGGDRPGAIR